MAAPTVLIPNFTTATVMEGAWNETVASQLANAFATQLSSKNTIKVVQQNKDNFISQKEMAQLGIKVKSSDSATEQSDKVEYIVLGKIISYKQAKAEERRRGVSFLIFNINRSKGESTVSLSLEIRIVDAVTGKIIDSNTLEGSAVANETKGGGSVNLGIVRFGSVAKRVEVDPPVEQAIEAALIAASDYVECILVKKDSCRREYENNN